MAVQGCIDGTLVIELADGWSAGAVAGRLLSELGARVIKLEPASGDRLRHIGPDADGGSSASFRTLNCNKESLTLALDTPEGRATFDGISYRADVLITDQTTVFDRSTNLDLDKFTTNNPQLVHCHFSPFGRLGPLASRGGGDLVSQAMGGVIATTGHPGKLPHKAGPPLAVHNAALMGGTSILAALFDRLQSNRGSAIDMALYDGMVSLLYTFIPGYFLSGKAPGPQGNQHPMAAPWDNFPTKDGWVIICMADDRQWQNFLNLIERSDLADDPRYLTNDERVKEEIRPEVNQLVIDFLADKTTEEALKILTEGQVPAGPIYSLPELIEDPQFLAREMVRIFKDEHGRPYRTPGSIFKMSKTPGNVHCRAPALGEHNEAGL
ncbi:MAG: CoA transferase [Pseudomonadota bacterium]|nr:CoA transferase [Pseudomonadota bacterium]